MSYATASRRSGASARKRVLSDDTEANPPTPPSTSQLDEDLMDDELAVPLIKSELPTTSSNNLVRPVRKMPRPPPLMSQSVDCHPISDVRQHPDWITCHTHMKERLAGVSNPASVRSYGGSLRQLEDEPFSWAEVDAVKSGQPGGPCDNCLSRGFACVVRIERDKDGKRFNTHGRCAACIAYHSSKKCTLVTREADQPETQIVKKAKTAYATPSSTKSTTLHTASPKVVVDIPTRSQGISSRPSSSALPPYEASDRTSVLAALVDLMGFSTRLQDVLQKDEELDLETKIMFEELERHIHHLEVAFEPTSRATRQRGSAIGSHDARDSVTFIGKVAKEMRDILSEGNGLSFRMETLLQRMERHVALIKTATQTLD